jgi:hypothetical protein
MNDGGVCTMYQVPLLGLGLVILKVIKITLQGQNLFKPVLAREIVM